MARVDHFIAISSGVRQALETALSVSPVRLSLVHNALDISLIDRLKNQEVSLPKTPGRLRILSMGRLVREKGHDVLIRAFAEVRKQAQYPLELLILGDGAERMALEQLVRDLGLMEHVVLLGLVANPYPWLKTADVFVSSSHWETFGISLAEAMILGLPVVATATDGTKDIVEPNINGLTVPSGHQQALAEAILTFVCSAELRESLGRQGQLRAQDFDVSVTVPQYEQILERILLQ